jgi:CHASE3 domain sensor protein
LHNPVSQQHKLQQGVDSLAQKKAAAQAKAQVLQQVLQDVQSQQRSLAVKVNRQDEATGQMRVKQKEYCSTQDRYQRRLAKSGFTPEVRDGRGSNCSRMAKALAAARRRVWCCGSNLTGLPTAASA